MLGGPEPEGHHFGRSGGHRRHEAITPAMDGLDVLLHLARVRKGFADLRHGVRQRGPPTTWRLGHSCSFSSSVVTRASCMLDEVRQ